jgi:5-methylcytosine-specific restriction endonuclease McrA
MRTNDDLSRVQLAIGDSLRNVSALVFEMGVPQRFKSVIGGAFGAHGFQIGSKIMVESSLETVLYLVGNSDWSLVVGSGRSVPTALAVARDVLAKIPAVALSAIASEERARREYLENERRAEWQSAKSERRSADETKKTLPKRRVRIFEASGGECHYCHCSLDINGKWHVEHKMPVALMGSDADDNLVASCVSCNLAKRDRTDVEFVALLAARRAA